MTLQKNRRAAKLMMTAVAAAAGTWSAGNARAATITQYTFNATVAAPDNSVTPTTGTGTGTPLGMTNSYTYAGGEGPGSSTSADVTQPATSSTPSSNEFAWRIRGNSNKKNAGPGNANGWNNSAPNYTQGAEFSSNNTAGFNNLSLSFDWFCTTSGVANMQVRYTLDDTVGSPTWVNLGSDYVAVSNNFYGSTTPNITIPLPAAANGDANFAVEMVSVKPVPGDSNYSVTNGDGAYAAADGSGDFNNSSGNWSFNNITISGSAVPEPASLGVLGMGALSLLKRRRGNKTV